MLDNPVKKLIESEINLPSPPAIAVQILNTVQQEESDLNDLTKIISADPALTGKMLQIANSSFYSLETEVTSIDRALSVLGTNVIKNIALSFVRNPDDISAIKTLLKDLDSHAGLIAKIEKPEAVENIDEILEILDFGDAIMIARGDLGVEVKIHKVPAIQK
ncbi:MAG: pyruvate kinase, partial [Deltaproteobacteria bacterium]|nr:pyruvate kinase [Deltaproteobacteria bacterium]